MTDKTELLEIAETLNVLVADKSLSGREVLCDVEAKVRTLAARMKDDYGHQVGDVAEQCRQLRALAMAKNDDSDPYAADALSEAADTIERLARERDEAKIEAKRLYDEGIYEQGKHEEYKKRAEQAEAALDLHQKQFIEVEKLLCAALGREWAATGFSVETLIAGLQSQLTTALARVERMRVALDKVRKFIDESIVYVQPRYDEPPEPASKDEYEKISVVQFIDAALQQKP